jgi:hypothetical protein
MLTLVPVLYDDIRGTIQNGDIGLCRPTGIEGQLILDATHATYSHAALFGWAGNCLMIGETREHRDARLIDARSEIKRWPGTYDVWRVKGRRRVVHRVKGYDGDAAWSFACRAAGTKYGYKHIWKIFCRRTLGLDVFAPQNSDDPQTPRFCSELVQAALRNSGGAIFKDLDIDVAPGDLANPDLLDYVCTLYYEKSQIKGVNV